MVSDVTTHKDSQPIWKLKSTFVQVQNSFFKLKFPSFRRTSSKYNTKQQTIGQLCIELTKIFTRFWEIVVLFWRTLYRTVRDLAVMKYEASSLY